MSVGGRECEHGQFSHWKNALMQKLINTTEHGKADSDKKKPMINLCYV